MIPVFKHWFGKHTARHATRWILAACLAVISGFAEISVSQADQFSKPYHAIVVRTTENISNGGWKWLLQEAKAAGITRIDVLVKQDEDNFKSKRTDKTLQSGELLVELPGETTAAGWEDSKWLVQMLARAKEIDIEVWAWWPVFHDAQTAALYPEAQYLGGDRSVFVDASVKGVQARQEELIAKLLKTYAFDGISLDWLRYDNWVDGSTGPLAEKYFEKTGSPLTPQRLEDARERAIWGDIRETSISEWVAQLIASTKTSLPELQWGGYLLPPQFKEVSQNYASLAQAGLETIQPMIYWDIWGHEAKWAGEVVGKRIFWQSPDTKLVPTLDINLSELDIIAGVDAMGESGISGYLWYLDGPWTDWHFGKIKRLQNRLREAKAQAMSLNSPLPEPSAFEPASAGVQPEIFPPDSSAWTLVMLAELYDQGALDNPDRVIPVLALHRFTAGQEQEAGSKWANSTAYIDRLMTFLSDRIFSVIPLSRLQAYMVSGAADDLPPRPLVLTVDDGALSVLQHFHPKASERKLPYALSIISNPLDPKDPYLDEERSDRQLTWEEVQQLAASGLVELVSHTHKMHTYLSQAPNSGLTAPSIIALQWLEGQGRRETATEHYRRVLGDLSTSREVIMRHSGQPVTTLAWPYGAFDETAERAAREAGFTHFLQFGGSHFAQPAWTNHRIARMPITMDDEGLPLTFPKDHATRQRWWLAFLDYARRTASVPLIEATLIQLDDEQAIHPEAELARAALDVLRGKPEIGTRRIEMLRTLFPNNPALKDAIASFIATYKKVL